MERTEIDIEDVDIEVVGWIIEAIIEAIDGVTYLDPTMGEVVIAVDELLQALVEIDEDRAIH